ncbi:hypothetical protein HY989_03390 [Candidatus Micrarchaeota archaeon]|nr:hypothetical protein [Candidatus Micrarchaeota archaeon]
MESKELPISKFIGDPIKIFLIATTKPLYSITLFVLTYFSLKDLNSFNMWNNAWVYFIGQILWWFLLFIEGFDFISGDPIKFINSKAVELQTPPMNLRKALVNFIALPTIVMLFLGAMLIVSINFELLVNLIFSLIKHK